MNKCAVVLLEAAIWYDAAEDMKLCAWVERGLSIKPDNIPAPSRQLSNLFQLTSHIYPKINDVSIRNKYFYLELSVVYQIDNAAK